METGRRQMWSRTVAPHCTLLMAESASRCTLQIGIMPLWMEPIFLPIRHIQRTVQKKNERELHLQELECHITNWALQTDNRRRKFFCQKDPMKVHCTEAKQAKMDEKGRRPENVDLLVWYEIVNKNRICTLLIY